MSAAGLLEFPSDPPLRADGRCVQCGGERKLPPKRHRAEAEVDPFCSSPCCRAWYGMPTEDRSRERAAFQKRAYV